MPTTTTETRRGVGDLINLVGRVSQVREASPVDTGAATVAQLNHRLTAIERRINVLEARRS